MAVDLMTDSLQAISNLLHSQKFPFQGPLPPLLPLALPLSFTRKIQANRCPLSYPSFQMRVSPVHLPPFLPVERAAGLSSPLGHSFTCALGPTSPTFSGP